MEHFKDLFDGIFVVFSDGFVEAFQQEGIDFIKGLDEVLFGDAGVHIQNAKKGLLSDLGSGGVRRVSKKKSY